LNGVNVALPIVFTKITPVTRPIKVKALADCNQNVAAIFNPTVDRAGKKQWTETGSVRNREQKFSRH
jgi:hypothetical protein